MARGDVNVMPPNVPGDLDWVEDVVLASKSMMDEELIQNFRETLPLCSEESVECKYELVPPNSEERVCYYNMCFPEERHFLYMYECLFHKLGVRIPFSSFEQDVLYDCRVASTQLHPNMWVFMKAFQSVCWHLQLDLSLKVFIYFFYLTKPFSRKKVQWTSFRSREGRRIFTLYEESFHDFKNYYFKVRLVEGSPPFFENERGNVEEEEQTVSEEDCNHGAEDGAIAETGRRTFAAFEDGEAIEKKSSAATVTNGDLRARQLKWFISLTPPPLLAAVFPWNRGGDEKNGAALIGSGARRLTSTTAGNCWGRGGDEALALDKVVAKRRGGAGAPWYGGNDSSEVAHFFFLQVQLRN
ncbi:hypothetical protein PIB30_038464 [Stylosanthes scabra]|uniref:Transposase (putative) gypsy type domain-containing protein n=1 Tax=Stylosanthes scabra TaxID=79078 RepID=A0ABU6ZC40_9FABA|nr:hypothetical protein [Stylosanthes scabra]